MDNVRSIHTANKVQAERRRRRKDAMIAAYAMGKTNQEAAREVGISVNTHHQWRKDDPQYAASVDAARSRSLAPAEFSRWSESFSAFRKLFFGMDTFSHQERIVEALDNVGPREIVLILIWPEAGKTTTLEDWICQKLALDPNQRITILSESSGLAKKSIGRIKSRMTDSRMYPEYIARFGPFYEDGQEREGKPWAKEYFTSARADHDERDFSVEARAITSAAYGTRIDTLIVDDVISARNVAQSDNVLHTLRQTYLTRGRQMRTVIIGTRIAPNDLYEKLIESELIDRLVEIPAIQGEGRITCPELWCDEEVEDPDERHRIAQIRVNKIREQVGETVWHSSYQQNPQDPGIATFSEEMVEQSKDFARRVQRPEPGQMVVCSLDPALGGGCALMSAIHTAAQMDVLDLDLRYELSRTEEILSMVEGAAIRYQPSKLVVETDAMQKGLADDQRLRDLGAQYGFRIVPHQTRGRKLDPLMGVASMAGSFLRREIRLPYADDNARAIMAPLINELLKWRATIPTKLLRQDTVMALWFNWRHWMIQRQDANYDASMFRMRGLPYEPTGVAL